MSRALGALEGRGHQVHGERAHERPSAERDDRLDERQDQLRRRTRAARRPRRPRRRRAPRPSAINSRKPQPEAARQQREPERDQSRSASPPGVAAAACRAAACRSRSLGSRARPSRSPGQEVGCTSCSDGAVAPIDDDLVPERAGLEAALDRARERDVRVAGGPRVVDPGALAAEPAGVDRPAGGALDGRDRQRLQTVDRVRQPAQRAGVPSGSGRCRPSPARTSGLLAAEDLGGAVLADLGGAEDHVARAARREDERVVGDDRLLAVAGALGELDVVDDRLGPVAEISFERLGDVRRENGQRSRSSENVTSSMPTTTKSFGTGRAPRISKRVSTVDSSARSNAFVMSSSTTIATANRATPPSSVRRRRRVVARRRIV